MVEAPVSYTLVEALDPLVWPHSSTLAQPPLTPSMEMGPKSQIT